MRCKTGVYALACYSTSKSTRVLTWFISRMRKLKKENPAQSVEHVFALPTLGLSLTTQDMKIRIVRYEAFMT